MYIWSLRSVYYEGRHTVFDWKVNEYSYERYVVFELLGKKYSNNKFYYYSSWLLIPSLCF
jgi:hypothetical protein